MNFVGNFSTQPDSHNLAMWTYIPRAEHHFIYLDLVGLYGKEDCESLQKPMDIPGRKEMKLTTVATKLETFLKPSMGE